jgi:hypothetical protein
MRLLRQALGIGFAVVGLCGCASTGDQSATCATTLLGGQEICGEELVAFCRQNYDPSVNGEVCAPVLTKAGVDPKSLVPQPPEQATFGARVIVEGSDGERIAVTTQRLLDELPVGQYDSAGAGKRYMAVELRIVNRGRGELVDFPSAKLVLGNGRQLDPSITLDGDCDDIGSVELAPGDDATACIPFEVPYEATLRRFQLKIGTEGFVARWRIDLQTPIDQA